MRLELKTLRKHPLAVCLGAALTLGGPLLAAVPSAASHQAPFSKGPVQAFLADASSRLPAALRPAPIINDATTRKVTNCNDSGNGSLRDIVAASEDRDVVDLTDLRCSTITLTSGAIGVTLPHLHIYSLNPGAVTIDGGGTDRIFNHQPGFYGRLYLQGVNVTNGSSAGNGGCIYSTAGLYLDQTEISNCHVNAVGTPALGGAIYTKGNLRLGGAKVTSSEAHSDTTYAKGGGVYVADEFVTSDSTLSGNSATSDDARTFGGGAFVKGRTYIQTSTIDNNHAVNVGGIAMAGGRYKTADIRSSTISGNSAEGFMGGVYSSVQLKVSNSTIAFNCANSTELAPGYIAAIGLQNYVTAPELQSSIIASNDLCAPARPNDVLLDDPYDISLYGVGPITGANNLIVTSAVTLPDDTLRDDPGLLPLAANGGSTWTHALPPGSAAIDTGNNTDEDQFDQRGLWSTRVVGAAADIGAFELQSIGPTRQVTNCDDSGEGSLRDIVGRSQSGDGVDLSALGCSTITLSNGAIEIPQGNLRMIGPGAQTLTIDGNNLDRVLFHSGSGTLELQGLRLVNGYLQASSSEGIGTGACLASVGRVLGEDVVVSGCKAQSGSYTCIGGGAFALDIELADSVVSHNSCASTDHNAAGGGVAGIILVLDRTTVSDNIATTQSSYSFGGGFAGFGTETVTSSTISGNRADRAAGGFFAAMTMTNSTVSGNTAVDKGGGLYGFSLHMFNSTVTGNSNTASVEPASGGIFVVRRSELESSIVFGNTLDATPYDFGGVATLLVGANNLIGVSTIIPPLDTITDDPHLGPLQDNGGLTFTHALLPGSPAIDAGNDAADLADDQRGNGFVRVSGAAADIGAFEVQAVDDHLFVDGFDPESLR